MEILENKQINSEHYSRISNYEKNARELKKFSLIDPIKEEKKPIRSVEERFKSVLKILEEKKNMKPINFLAKGGFGKIYELFIHDRRFALKLIDYEQSIDESINEKSSEINKHIKMINNELHYSLLINYKHCLKGITKMNFPDEKICGLLSVYCENSDLNFLQKLFFSNKIFKNIKIRSNDSANNYLNHEEKNIMEINSCLKNPTELFLKFFIHQILLGLKYLSECGLLHLDLKPKNIFLNKSFFVRIGDFGTILQKKEFKNIPNISTKIYQAPEFLFGIKDKISINNVEKFDIYSVGCIIYNFLFNETYINEEEIEEIKRKVIKKIIIDPIEEYKKIFEKKIINNEDKKKKNFFKNHENLHDFLIKSLDPEITNRLSIKCALNHEWVKNEANFDYHKEMHDNDSIKFLLELQKIQYSKYMKDQLSLNYFGEECKNLGKDETKIYDYYE